jgi:hypothetical protein
MNACRVCRAIPKGLRDWLLRIFAAGDTADPLWPVALPYAQWGAARLVRGEAKPYLLLRHRPGDIDPMDALRAWFPLAVRDLIARQRGAWPDGNVRGALDLTPGNLRELAGQFQVGEPAVRRAIERAESLLRDYGPDIGRALLGATIEKSGIPCRGWRYGIWIYPTIVYWTIDIQGPVRTRTSSSNRHP